jgi:hypothetical protein
MWEYAQIKYRGSWDADGKFEGWDGWEVAPKGVKGPPEKDADGDALNHMGKEGWELVAIDEVVVRDPQRERGDLQHCRRYTFKRPL